MPILPSGRRVEFSLDRLHAILGRIGRRRAREIAENLNDPDDLLLVLDAVHFRADDGAPYFAGYVAADWRTYAADWSHADRQALRAWFGSAAAVGGRAEAIDYIRALFLGEGDGSMSYPYLMAEPDGLPEGSRLRQ